MTYSIKFNKAELLCKDWYEMKKYLESLQSEIYHKQILFNKNDLVEVINLIKKYGYIPYSFYTLKNNELWYLTTTETGLELIKVNAKLTNPVIFSIVEEMEVVNEPKKDIKNDKKTRLNNKNKKDSI